MSEPRSSAELLELIGAEIEPLETDYLPLRRCTGRALAEQLSLDRADTAERIAERGGFGVRFTDVQQVSPDNPLELKVVNYHPNNLEFILGDGKAIEVEEGLVLPNGCDTVIPGDWANWIDSENIRVGRRVEEKGRGTRIGGETESDTERVLEAGTVLTPALCLYLAERGVAEVPVHRPPSLGHLTLGEHWVDIRVRRLSGERRRNIVPFVLRQLGDRLGLPVLDLDKTGAEQDELRAELEDGLRQSDLLVLIGDYRRGLDALSELGEVLAASTGIAGAEQFALGLAEGIPVTVLPSDPQSAVLAASTLLRTVAARRAGSASGRWAGESCELVDDERPAGRTEQLFPALRETGGCRRVETEGNRFWREGDRIDGIVLARSDAEDLFFPL